MRTGPAAAERATLRLASMDTNCFVSTDREQIELADILRQHGQAFKSTHKLPLRHCKVMQQIINCRTATLGGHRQWCARCGYQRYLYHSCRNRHCPKCQIVAQEAWRQSRLLELLPVPYFHNVFTIPHELNGLILKTENNQRLLLKLLFEATSKTLLQFGRRELRGQVGFTLVLHTWDQQLRPHFHLHCLIAAGALAENGTRWVAGGRQFLFPVQGLSTMFRAKFLCGVKKLLQDRRLQLTQTLDSPLKQRQLVRTLFRKPWVVYSKAPFAGPAKLIDYLSRYTHRVAITNNRIKSCRDGHVTFHYRDRRDSDRRKQTTLPVSQFIGRFLSHVLPTRFMRIRHYGYLANRFKQVRLKQIRRTIGARPPQSDVLIPQAAQQLLLSLGMDTQKCPCCGNDLITEEIASSLTCSNVAKAGQTQLPQPARGPP